jgi:hypothetical protein
MSISKLVHHWVLNGLAREEGSKSDWVHRCIQLWEIACGGEGEGDYMDVVLAFTISVKNCSLQMVTAPTIASLIDTLMEWIWLLDRDGGYWEKILGMNEESLNGTELGWSANVNFNLSIMSENYILALEKVGITLRIIRFTTM